MAVATVVFRVSGSYRVQGTPELNGLDKAQEGLKGLNICGGGGGGGGGGGVPLRG